MTGRWAPSQAFFNDLSPDERAEAYEAAEKRYHVESFWDLDPAERADVYDRALDGIGWGAE